jgi:hypothetical protein
MSGLLVLLAGCRPADVPLPTLAPTLSESTDSPTQPPTAAIPTLTVTKVIAVTLTLTATKLPDTALPIVTLVQTALASVTTVPPTADSDTIPPPKVVNSNGALTIALTAAQLNQAVTRRFAANPLAGFSAPPQITLFDGGLRLALNMAAAAQPITLTLTLTAQTTTTGNQLDIRAVALSPLKGVTTLQVKPAQMLLADTLTAIMQQYAASANFDMTYVAVTPNTLTLSLITH